MTHNAIKYLETNLDVIELNASGYRLYSNSLARLYSRCPQLIFLNLRHNPGPLPFKLDQILPIRMYRAFKNCSKIPSVIMRNLNSMCSPSQPQELTLQPGQPRFPQAILRQHPTDCPLQDLSTTPFPNHTFHIQTLQCSWPRSLLII